MASENTIALTKQHMVREDRRNAAAAITPGELLEIDSNGDFAAHSTAGGNAQPIVALENELLGKGIDTDIASGDQVPAGYMQRGAMFVGRLDSSSDDASAGDPLESAGNGNLRVFSTQTSDQIESIVGFAEEDVTSPASGSTPIRVRAA